jgi:hypothetical protein
VRPELTIGPAQLIKTGCGFSDFRHLATQTPLRKSKV